MLYFFNKGKNTSRNTNKKKKKSKIFHVLGEKMDKICCRNSMMVMIKLFLEGGGGGL